MNEEQQNSGPILRLFEVRPKPGCAAELIEKFRVTSIEVVQGYPGNLGYFFGHGVEADEEYVAFTSVWKNLDAVKARFGDTWKESFLPPGYEDLIEEHTIRHIDVGRGWNVDIPKDT